MKKYLIKSSILLKQNITTQNDYHEKYMKIRNNVNDDLPLKKRYCYKWW